MSSLQLVAAKCAQSLLALVAGFGVAASASATHLPSARLCLIAAGLYVVALIVVAISSMFNQGDQK